MEGRGTERYGEGGLDRPDIASYVYYFTLEDLIVPDNDHSKTACCNHLPKLIR